MDIRGVAREGSPPRDSNLYGKKFGPPLEKSLTTPPIDIITIPMTRLLLNPSDYFHESTFLNRILFHYCNFQIQSSHKGKRSRKWNLLITRQQQYEILITYSRWWHRHDALLKAHTHKRPEKASRRRSTKQQAKVDSEYY